MNSIVIIGAGSHTRSSINLLKQRFPDVNYAIFDDSFDERIIESIHGINLVGKIADIPMGCLIYLSVGDNALREKYFIDFKKRIIQETLIHKNAIIEKYAVLGQSNQIYANAYINSYVTIGANNIINTAAILEHEVRIGNHNHIAVGAKICGRVSIADRCFIGAGAVIIDKISIHSDVVIGAGAIVTHDITEKGIYIGIPARKVK